jgi:hypothetical protein
MTGCLDGNEVKSRSGGHHEDRGLTLVPHRRLVAELNQIGHVAGAILAENTIIVLRARQNGKRQKLCTAAFCLITLRGEMLTGRCWLSIDGMRTVILRGPLKPSGLDSFGGKGEISEGDASTQRNKG